MEFLERLSVLKQSYEDIDDLECFPVHDELTARLKKTLYEGRMENEGISLPLTDIVVELFENANQGHLGCLSKRHVANLTRRSNATQCSLFLSMIYARRLRESNPEYVTRIKPAELFLVSMMIATKFLYDEGEQEELYNDEWADAAKLDVNRVHDLEMEFLAAIDWKLLVDPLDFYEFLLAVETRIALNEGQKRGWFTYTDLCVLMQHPSWYEACSVLLEHMVKAVSICMLVYSLCAIATAWTALVYHQATIPAVPTNGCLPRAFGLHQAKSTEPHTIYNHFLLDLVFNLCLDCDGDKDAPAFPCLVPWYEVEQRELGKGRILWSPDDVSHDVAVERPDCRDCEANGNEAHCGRCSSEKSWIRNYQSLVAKVATVRETLEMFYSALLSARSDIAESSILGSKHGILNWQERVQPLTGCTTCTLESSSKQNMSDGGWVGIQPTCCSNRRSLLSNENQHPHLSSVFIDLSLGFRTSSETSVTV